MSCSSGAPSSRSRGLRPPLPIAAVSLDVDLYRSGHVTVEGDKQAKVRVPGEGAPGFLSWIWLTASLHSAVLRSQVKLSQYKSGEVHS